eukprot:791797-Prorocentrum_minimum.AAC.2
MSVLTVICLHEETVCKYTTRARLEEEQQMHSPTALGDKTKPINRAICSMADEMDKAGGQLSDIHVTHPPQYFKRYGAPRWPCLCAHTHDCFVLVCAYARLLCAHTHNYYVRVVMRSHARLLCARYHVRIRTTIMDAKTLIETELYIGWGSGMLTNPCLS